VAFISDNRMAVARVPGGSAGRVTQQVRPAAGGGDGPRPARLPALFPAAAGRQPGALNWPSGQATSPPDAALKVALALLLYAW
jgi:hypothetical protein